MTVSSGDFTLIYQRRPLTSNNCTMSLAGMRLPWPSVAFEIPDWYRLYVAVIHLQTLALCTPVPLGIPRKILRLLPVDHGGEGILSSAFLLYSFLYSIEDRSWAPFRYGDGFVIEFLLAGYLGIVERVLWGRGIYDVRDVNENRRFYVEIFVKNCLIYRPIW